ncbi:MAG: hypothetical protein QM758_16340 [Armatimonas sp.]
MRQLSPLLALGISLSAISSAHAFAGEDFLALNINNWHHADITCTGAAGRNCFRFNDPRTMTLSPIGAGFTSGAAGSIAWHADYVDSYGYNPLWWAPGGLGRLRAALSCKPEITKVHFDDLVTTRLNSTIFDKIPIQKIKLLDTIKRDASMTARGDQIGAAMSGVKLDAATLSQITKTDIQTIQKTGLEKFQIDAIKKIYQDHPPRNAVELQMRRYLSGTLAGLVYAANQNDVGLAHQIVGTSLHAVQDFYSHSNWIDVPERRGKTYFDMATNEWSTLGTYPLYTGTYETPTQTGVISHGKYLFACSVMNQPGIKNLLDIGCGAFSPIANDPVCLEFKECKTGKPVSGAMVTVPGLPQARIPNNLLYLAPPGINVDSTWMAEIGARQRRIVAGEPGALPDSLPSARAAFDTAESLATKATQQWLRRLEAAMTKVGLSGFWNRIKTESSINKSTSVSYLNDSQQGYRDPANSAMAPWEDFSKLGYQFVSAGTYPPRATDIPEQSFLRLKINTSTDQFSGTDADIVVSIPGEGEFVLDNMPAKGEGLFKKAISYNDFESGDSAVYLVGPLKNPPSSFTITNRSKTAGDVIVAAVEGFVKAVVDAVKSVVDGIVGFFKTLTGYDPDFVQKNQKVWRFADLPQNVGQSIGYTIDLNGGDEGNYKLHGSIRKTGDYAGRGAQGNASYVVRVDRLECIKESTWDRFTSSDEPFLATFVNALDGDIPANRRKLFGPFDDVDSGESRNIAFEFPAVTIPKGSGVISFPVLLMESDDESASERNDILNKFAGDTNTKVPEANFWDTLGAAVAPDWKVQRIEAWTFTKGDTIRSGQSGIFNNVGWIEGKQSKSFSLSVPAPLPIRAQDLEDMSGVTLSASDAPQRPLIALLGLTVGASLLGMGLLRAGKGR